MSTPLPSTSLNDVPGAESASPKSDTASMTGPGSSLTNALSASPKDSAATSASISALSISQTTNPSTASLTSNPPSTSLLTATPKASSARTQLSAPALAVAKNAVFSSSLASSQSASSLQESAPSASISVAVSSTATTQPGSSFQSQPSSSASPTISSSVPVVQLGASHAGEFAPVTAASTSAATKPSGVQYPTADKGNTPMAAGFNELYKHLDITSRCNADNSNEAIACISGEIAQCQADGTYVLKSCDQGQSCYALPKPAGATGITVECAVPSIAAAKLSAQSDAGKSAPAASQVQTKSQSSVTKPAGQSGSSFSAGSQAPSSTTISTASRFPLTESVQIPVQRLSSASQPTATFGTQTQLSITSDPASSPGLLQSESTRRGIEQDATTKSSKSGSGTTTEAESVQQPVQTLKSFPPAQATIHTQSASTSIRSSKPVHSQTQGESPAQDDATPQVPSVIPSATKAGKGPIFSIPDAEPSSTRKQDGHQAQALESSPSPQKSVSTAGPAALAQQQPTSTQASETSAGHFAQSVPSEPQASAVDESKAPSPSSKGSGITIVPLGDPDKVGTNEKLAVGRANGTPIYITVTVTTTAYTQRPTA